MRSPEMLDIYKDEILLLKELSFERWIKEFRELKLKGLNSWDLTLKEEDSAIRDLSPMAKFILSAEDFPFGFPPCDVRLFTRAVVEACGVSTNFDVELSELVSSGYYHIDECVAENARLALTADYPLNAKVIVLTEGVSDRRVIEAALRLFYPHLSDYYSFMDFEGANSAGGAGQLVTTVKAFAGAGITNRVIALFDNDTGARVALRGLDRFTLPQSMRAMRFPQIPMASNYPTRGPSGLVHMDVNDLACSLEMYFGEDVLRQADGEYFPIHWRGFDKAVNSYQGEIEGKGFLQDKFNQKLAAAVADPTLIETQDWRGIRAILDMVRRAFEN